MTRLVDRQQRQQRPGRARARRAPARSRAPRGGRPQRRAAHRQHPRHPSGAYGDAQPGAERGTGQQPGQGGREHDRAAGVGRRCGVRNERHAGQDDVGLWCPQCPQQVAVHERPPAARTATAGGDTSRPCPSGGRGARRTSGPGRARTARRTGRGRGARSGPGCAATSRTASVCTRQVSTAASTRAGADDGERDRAWPGGHGTEPSVRREARAGSTATR